MMRTHADSPLREELRDLLEITVQPLNLYGSLLSRFGHLGPEEISAWLADPATEGLRNSLQDLIPALEGPYLGLAARAALCNLLAQTTWEEERCLGIALLEHVALHLEPYLRAAELDPDQACYLRPLLDGYQLDMRPVDAFIAARRADRHAARVAEVQTTATPRRLADGG